MLSREAPFYIGYFITFLSRKIRNKERNGSEVRMRRWNEEKISKRDEIEDREFSIDEMEQR